MQRMVGRHQGMVWRRNPRTQQEGAGSRHVENGGEDGIEHLWAPSPWSNGWMDGYRYQAPLFEDDNYKWSSFTYIRKAKVMTNFHQPRLC